MYDLLIILSAFDQSTRASIQSKNHEPWTSRDVIPHLFSVQLNDSEIVIPAFGAFAVKAEVG